jgi:hypothetical protein
VRVLVANGARLMRELVLAVLADQSDIEVIGEIQNESELAIAVKESRAGRVEVALDNSDQRATQYGFLVGRYLLDGDSGAGGGRPKEIVVCSIGRWWTFRTRPLERSESGILSALREPPSLVNALHH